MALELVTIPNVMIMETGTFDLSTGPATFTEEDLAAAIAALEDPHVKLPRLKIGHTDGRFDGEPAFGKFDNLRLGKNNQAIFADIVGVPRWLAEIMPTAYPNRSIEGMYGYRPQRGGKEHKFVITAVSLLGVELPGITSLDDLKNYFDEPENVSIAAQVATYHGGNMDKKNVAAAVDVEDVRRTFYDAVATGDRNWWWIRAIQLDPAEVIVEDEDEGKLYRVPYAMKGDEVTFDEPVEVDIVYVDKKKAAKTGLKVFASAAESRPEGRGMTPKEIRQSLGLAEDATDEAVKAEIARLRAPGTEAPRQPQVTPNEGVIEQGEITNPANPGEVTPLIPAKGPAETDPDPKRVPQDQLAASKGVVQVDAATWHQVQQDAKTGAAFVAAQVKTHRDNVVAAAVQAGKIPPARQEHWRKLMEADPEGTESTLASLESVLPLHELGVNAAGAHEVSGDQDAYPIEWLNADERARAYPDPNAAAPVGPPLIMREP